MSDLTLCNFCILKKMKQKAKSRGNKIILRPSSFQGGIDVFEVARGKKMANLNLNPDDSECWMMEIGDRCEC